MKHHYRGFIIYSIGYYPPEKRVCWEVLDHDGGCFGHSFTLRDAKIRIDEEIEKEIHNEMGK